MQAGFCDDTRMMRSYCSSVRSNLDAATAYKVATVLLRAIKKHGSILLLVHLPFMRNYSAYFKGGITKFYLSPFLGDCWSCAGILCQKARTGVACISGIFRS